MNGKKPLLSIIVLTLDSSRHVVECLRSLAPPPEGVEILVVDGGSKDGTVDLVRTHFPFAEICLAEGTTIPEARNAGLRMSTGEWIMFLDSDELANRRILNTLIHQLEIGRPDVMITGYDETDAYGKFLRNIPPRRPDIILDLFRGMRGVVVCQRHWLVAIGGCRQKFELAEDYDLVLRLFERTTPTLFDGAIAAHRVHPDSVSHKNQTKMLVFSMIAALSASRRRRVSLPILGAVIVRYLSWILSLERLPFLRRYPQLIPRVLAAMSTTPEVW